MKVSTGLRNFLLANGSIKAALDGGEIRIYSGTVPATADAAIGSATLLVTIKNGSAGLTFDASATDGAIVKNPSETWSGTVTADGAASFYRHVLAADAGDQSASALRLQGTCALAGGDMDMTSVNLTNGSPQPLSYYVVALPTD